MAIVKRNIFLEMGDVSALSSHRCFFFLPLANAESRIEKQLERERTNDVDAAAAAASDDDDDDLEIVRNIESCNQLSVGWHNGNVLLLIMHATHAFEANGQKLMVSFLFVCPKGLRAFRIGKHEHRHTHTHVHVSKNRKTHQNCPLHFPIGIIYVHCLFI